MRWATTSGKKNSTISPTLKGQMLADEGGDADEYGHAQRDLVEKALPNTLKLNQTMYLSRL